jgi:hypothetical protein
MRGSETTVGKVLVWTGLGTISSSLCNGRAINDLCLGRALCTCGRHVAPRVQSVY